MHDKVKDEETKNQVNNDINEYFDLTSIEFNLDADGNKEEDLK